MASKSHFVVQIPQPIHLLASTIVAPQPKHLDVSFLICSSVSAKTLSLNLSVTFELIPSTCLGPLKYHLYQVV